MSSPEVSAAVREALQRLRGGFIADAFARRARLRAARDAAATGREVCADAVIRDSHKLAGASGMFELHGLTEPARAMERALTPPNAASPAAVVPLFDALLRALDDALDSEAPTEPTQTG